MLNIETKAEIRNWIVRANMALHKGCVDDLLAFLDNAKKRAVGVGLDDIERGTSMRIDIYDGDVDAK